MSNSHTVSLKETQRYEAFDSLRSLAALVVVLSHAAPMLRFDVDWPRHIAGFLDPRAAVVFFFVLSGFVLHLSFSKSSLSLSSFAGFQVRRIFRIYPLYYFSLLSVVAVIYCFGKEAFPPFYDATQKTLLANHLDIHQWLQQLLLIGPGFDPSFLNYPSWTLAVEMQAAMVFPFLSKAISRLSIRKGMAFIGLSFPLLLIIGNSTVYLGFVGMVPFFMVGAFFAQHRNIILTKKIAPWKLFVLGVVSLFLYGSRMNFPTWPTVCWYVCALGSVGLMNVALRSEGWASFLSRPSLTFLGKLSFGIYILHYPVILALSTQNLMLDGQKGSILFLIALGLIVGLAFLTYVFIEKPFIKLGKKLSAKFERRPSPELLNQAGVIHPSPLSSLEGTRVSVSSVTIH